MDPKRLRVPSCNGGSMDSRIPNGNRAARAAPNLGRALARFEETALDKFDRIYRLHQILATRRTPISLEDLKAKLDGCSKATVYRLIHVLEQCVGASIERDEELG